MGDVLAETVPLALAGAISPLALLGALVLLSGAKPLLRCGLYAVGIVTMTTLFFAATYIALRLNLTSQSGHHGLLSSRAA